MEKKDFPALTGIRFIAASLVFVFHYAHLILADGTKSYAYFFLRQLNIGVNLFFVLSGFLITYRYYEIRVSGQCFRYYIIKRLARIFPLYLLLLFIQFVLLYVSRHEVPSVKSVFLNLTLLKGLHSDYFFSGLAQSWSLTVEELFYLFAPFCFYLIRRKNIFWLQVPTVIGIGFLIVYSATRPSSYIYFSGSSFMWVGTFFGRCFEFFVGIYLALVVMGKKATAHSTCRYTFLGGLIFLILLTLLAYVDLKADGAFYSQVIKLLLFNFLIPISAALFYYGLIREKTYLSKALATKVSTLLGKSSYAFYLLHVGMIAEVIFYHFITTFILLYTVLQFLSIGLYKLFEKPVYFFILRKFAAFKPLTARAE